MSAIEKCCFFFKCNQQMCPDILLYIFLLVQTHGLKQWHRDQSILSCLGNLSSAVCTAESTTVNVCTNTYLQIFFELLLFSLKAYHRPAGVDCYNTLWYKAINGASKKGHDVTQMPSPIVAAELSVLQYRTSPMGNVKPNASFWCVIFWVFQSEK